MSHVLIGIIGVILFIGVALAGASYFGPRVTSSNSQAQAGLMLLTVSQVANGVVVRNRELEVTTPATFPVASLVPNYMPELPVNLPGAIFIADRNGLQAGPAGYVGLKIQSSSAARICDEISKQSGGPASAPAIEWSAISRPMGCVRAPNAIGSHIAAGDLIAFAAID